MLEKRDYLQQETSPDKLKNKRTTLNSIVIVVAIIMLWRGVWGLLDVYLFPGIPTLSYLVSITLGILVLYLNDFHLDNLKR